MNYSVLLLATLVVSVTVASIKLHQASVFIVVIIRAYCVPQPLLFMYLFGLFNIHPLGSITAVLSGFW
jgi:hypothetical protein